MQHMWNILGEVRHAGKFGIYEGEKLLVMPGCGWQRL
jgi:hypothetical protein